MWPAHHKNFAHNQPQKLSESKIVKHRLFVHFSDAITHSIIFKVLETYKISR